MSYNGSRSVNYETSGNHATSWSRICTTMHLSLQGRWNRYGMAVTDHLFQNCYSTYGNAVSSHCRTTCLLLPPGLFVTSSRNSAVNYHQEHSKIARESLNPKDSISHVQSLIIRPRQIHTQIYRDIKILSRSIYSEHTRRTNSVFLV